MIKKTVKKSRAKKTAPTGVVGEFVIARCTSAGVHAGVVESTDANHTVLRDSRRIWHWQGAASLSEIAAHGVNPSKVSACKIAVPVPLLRLRDADICELIVCLPAGRKSVQEIPSWRA